MILYFIITLFKIVGCRYTVQFLNGSQFKGVWQVIEPSSGPLTSNVSTQEIFGGDQIFNQNTRVWNIFVDLPDHELLTIDVYMKFYSYMNDSRLYAIIDEKQIFFQCQQNIQDNHCTIKTPHNSISAIISIDTKDDMCWGIYNFTLTLDDYKPNQFEQPTGEEINLQYLMNENNDGWSVLSHSNQFQRIEKFNVLGSNQPNQFNLQKTFNLVFQAHEIIMQLKLLSKSFISSITIFINDQIFNLPQQQNNNLNYKIFCVSNIKLNTSIYPTHIINIKILNEQSQNIYGIRDFRLQYKYEDNLLKLIPGCLNQINNDCWECETGWFLVSDIKNCFPICGDQQIQFYEQCDDGNDTPYDGCFYCIFSCPLHCELCEFGKCIGMNTIELNNNIQIEDILPIHICGDGIIQYYEQCDDGNNTPYDGCYLCLYQCNLNCQMCNYGICTQCIKGYQLINKLCYSYCGDQLKTQDEQCDDGYLLNNCHNCQYKCKQGCQYCIDNYCIECFEGWDLNYDGICEQKCKDNKVAILSIEQCDDNQSLICQDCQIICLQYCSVCQDIDTCKQCDEGFEIINGQCQPICGDGIVIPDYEECDDGNNISNDGCYQCKIQCKEGCIKCNYQLQCILCDEQYDLDQQLLQCIIKKVIQNDNINNDNNKDDTPLDKLIQILCGDNYILIENKCVSQCGDGQINQIYEICDDGNQQGGDGCSSSCDIEDQYICQTLNNGVSECVPISKPKFILTNNSNKKSSIQTIKLTFSEQVKLLSQILIEDIIHLQVNPPVRNNIILKNIVNATTTLSNVSFEIEVTLYENVQQPILEVNIMKNNFYSFNDQELQQLNKSISLGDPFILSQDNQLKAQKITIFNDIVIYSLIGIASYAVITGNMITFINMLNLLQQLSYLRYIQYEFPSHLKQFLDAYSKISLAPIFDKLEIDEKIAQLNGGTLPFIGNKNKRLNKEINALNQYYILNAKSCYFSIIISIITYTLCSIIISNKVQLCITNLLLNKKWNITKIHKIHKINFTIRSICYNIKQSYIYTGILQQYSAILHQLLFSSFLQFPDYSFDSWLNIFNSINAMTSLFIILFIAFKSFSIIVKSNKKVFQYKFYFGECQQKYWQFYFKSFQMIKTISYMIIIVFCINYPEVQSFLLSASSTIFLYYLLKYQPLKCQLEQTKFIIRELMILLLTGSFAVYRFELTNDQLLIFGWIHIGMIVTIMISTFIIDSIKQIKQFYAKYLVNKRIEQLKLEAMYYNNPLQKFVRDEHILFGLKK